MGLLNKLFGLNPKENLIRETEKVVETAKSSRSRAQLFEDMKLMIEHNFPEYQVLYKMNINRLDPECHPACTPVEFMFTKNGEYVLAVVIVRQNTYRGMNVIGTKKICEGLGITYIRFFEEYPNEESYVIPRIRENL